MKFYMHTVYIYTHVRMCVCTHPFTFRYCYTLDLKSICMYVCSDCDISRRVRAQHLLNSRGFTASVAEGSYRASSTTLPTGQVPAAAAILSFFMSIPCSWQLRRSVSSIQLHLLLPSLRKTSKGLITMIMHIR